MTRIQRRSDRPDQAAIDRAVSEFRDHLDRLDPAALSAALAGQPGARVERAPEPESPDAIGDHGETATETGSDTVDPC